MVSQTYTPPSCTLKVTTKGSSLLAMLGRPRRQQFELDLDDPRLPEDRHFRIKGDRSQLEVLYETVNSYVRDFLKYSPTDNSGDFSPSQPRELPDTILETSDTNDNFKQDGGKQPPENPYSLTANSGIYLQPRDLFAHELFLGTLATEKTGPMIVLSVLHLFDLLVALEQCQRDLIGVAYLESESEVEATPAWLRSLALILLTAGLSVLAVRLYDRYILARQNESNLATDNTIDNLLDGLLSPSPSAVTPPVSPLPSPTVSSSPLVLPTPPTPGGVPNVKPSPIDVPVLFPSPVPKPSSPIFSFPPPNSRANTTIPSSGTNVVILPQIPPPIPPQRPVLPPPAIPDTSVPLQPRPPMPPAPNITSPLVAPGSYPRNVPQMSRNGVKPFIDVTRLSLNVPSDIALPALDDTNVALIPKDKLDGETVKESENSDRNLFDKIPQVAEVRKHFEDTWEVPEELEKNLQYSLLLNSDGSIQKVIPIGQASVDFYEDANMPVEKEPFVSSLEEGKTATVRLVLRNNGKVQTFLESLR